MKQSRLIEGETMLKQILAGAMLIAAAAWAPPAAATPLNWTFSFSLDNGDTASGTLTTDSTLVAGYYTVTSLSGTIGGNSMTLLSPDGSFNDNEFSPTGPYFDGIGLGFTAGGYQWALYSSGGITVDSWCNNAVNGFDHFCTLSGAPPYDPSGAVLSITAEAAVSDVPEPASMALLGIGLLGVGMLRTWTPRQSLAA